MSDAPASASHVSRTAAAPARDRKSAANSPAGATPSTGFRRRVWAVAVAMVIAGVAGYFAWSRSQQVVQAAPVQQIEIVARFPHDRNAFTQGLAFSEGRLFEGTGQFQKSQLREVDLKTGRILRAKDLPPSVFGEGITIWDKQIFQLSWQNQIGFVFDRDTFQLKSRFRYRGEGWGLTHDGEHLILSDGTARLRFLNPKTFRQTRILRVRDGRRDVARLNELEYINGEIWANVWHSDFIARISPKTGQVLAWVDLRGLHPNRAHDEAVLNGIAWNGKTKKLYVTGKDWPTLFEIRLKPVNP